MPAVLTVVILVTVAFGPKRLHTVLLRRSKDRHPVERFTVGSSLDRELEVRLAPVTADTQAAARQLVDAWQDEPVMSAVWDPDRGSLRIEAAGVVAALAIVDPYVGRGIATMATRERAWVQSCIVDDQPTFRLASDSWSYLIDPQGVAVVDGAIPR